LLATITLATTKEPIGTWLGSTARMVLADAIAIAIGGASLRRVGGSCCVPFHAR
jgi:putative Ca2+/H+ antiporter (TMEM165/GDT1 family)